MATIGSEVTSEIIKIDTFTGDGGTTFSPLSVTVESPSQLGVHNNGYYQVPTTDYTVNGNQIIFNVAPTVGNTIAVLHLGVGTIATGIEIRDNTVTTSTLRDLSVTGEKITESSVHAGGTINAASVSILGNNIVNNEITGKLILSNFYSNTSVESSNTFNVYTFNGTTSGIRIYNTTNYAFGSDDFTIEFWMNASSIGQTTYATIMDGTTNNSGTAITLSTNFGNNPLLRGRIHFNAQRGSTPNMVSSTVVTDNTWHHVACVKSGNNGYLFIDGVLENTTNSWASVTAATLSDGQIGRSRYGDGLAGDNTYKGKLAQIRILNGTALYTSNFAPPITGVTAIANTQLLIVANTVIDTGLSSYPLTAKSALPSVSEETFTLYANASTFIIPEGHLTGNLIADNAIAGNNIVVGTITGNLIADTSIRGNQIVQGTLTGNLIAANTLAAPLLAGNTLQQITVAHLPVQNAYVYSFPVTGLSRAGRLPPSNNLRFGSDDFTIEFWMQSANVALGSENQYIIDGCSANNQTGLAIKLTANYFGPLSDSNKIQWSAQQNAVGNLTSTSNVSDGFWHHIACVKSGSNGYLFIDGTLENTATNWSAVTQAAMANGVIGRSNALDGNAGQYMYGFGSPTNSISYLSNIRVLKGTALYTTNFTPPRTVLTAIANTQLLINASTFIDSSNNNHTIIAPVLYPSLSVSVGGLPNATQITSGYANTYTGLQITGNLFAANTITGNLLGLTSLKPNNFGRSIESLPNKSDRIARVQVYSYTIGDIYPGNYTFTIPSETTRIKITGVGGGGGSGAIVTGSGATPSTPTTTVGGEGGGGATFVLYAKGPFSPSTFNITVGGGGSGGLSDYNANTVTPGSPGANTRIWNLHANGSNISVSANGGSGAAAWNSFGYGRPSLPYGFSGIGGKGGIAGAANTSNSNFIILTYAGFNGNVGNVSGATEDTKALGMTRYTRLGSYAGLGATGIESSDGNGNLHNPLLNSQLGWRDGAPGSIGAVIIEY